MEDCCCKHKIRNKQIFWGVIRRQIPIKSHLQTSALENYHTEGRAHTGLNIRGKVESVHIGYHHHDFICKSYHLTLMLVHNTAGEESKMMEKDNCGCNALIKCLCKEHPSPFSPTSNLVQQTCLTPIWKAGTAFISVSVFPYPARLEILFKYRSS